MAADALIALLDRNRLDPAEALNRLLAPCVAAAMERRPDVERAVLNEERRAA